MDAANREYFAKAEAYHADELALLYNKRVAGAPGKAQPLYDRATYRIELLNAGLRSCGTFEDVTMDCTAAIGIMRAHRFRHGLTVNKSWLYYNHALALWSQGSYADALTSLEEAVRLDPADPDPRYLGAQILAALGKVPEARAWLAEAGRLGPQYGPAWRAKAAVLTASGELEAAIGVYDQFLAQWYSPSGSQAMYMPLAQGEAHALRAALHERVGAREKMLSDYCHCLLWEPDWPEAPRMRAAIAEWRQSRGW